MFSPFCHHGHLGLLPMRSQMVQFFIQPVHTLSNSRLGEQLQPLLPLCLLIDPRPRCSDSVCAIDGFDPYHHPLRDGVTPGQLVEGQKVTYLASYRTSITAYAPFSPIGRIYTAASRSRLTRAASLHATDIALC